MRLGRRLTAGIAEDPPAPVPAEVEPAAPVVGTAEVAPEPATPRTPDPIGTGA